MNRKQSTMTHRRNFSRYSQITHRAFTIVEVLIALTAALLLMLGLTRAYKLLGDRVTASQSELELSESLRSVAFRLRDELRRVTVDPRPPVDNETGSGYLTYYEGPFTSNTTILGDWRDSLQPEYFPSSRYGDFDDYLAFTATAAPGNTYSGFIPWGVLEAHRLAANPAGWVAPQGFQPNLRVPFYSDVAEIVYWVSPRWARVKQLSSFDGTLDYDAGSGYPLSPDADRDLLPDRMDLHRRVLLVRPDLNMTQKQMDAVNQLSASTNSNNSNNSFTREPLVENVPTIPFMQRSGQGWSIVPLTTLSTINNRFNKNYFPDGAFLSVPGEWLGNFNTASPNWLCGVARMQQVMDLSVSRTVNDWDQPLPVPTGVTTRFGMPSSIMQANSLADLSSPDTRFAHVRMPEPLLSGNAGSTMPLLALSPPHPYLMARENIFPNQAANTLGTAPPGAFGYGRFTLLGSLRPEFNLADRMTDVNSAVGGPVGLTTSINRGGSDVIATDVLGFDVKAFDPEAPKYIWLGRDSTSGSANDDDLDGSGNHDADELGLPGSDDEIVTMSHVRLHEVLFDNDSIISGPGVFPAPGPFQLVDRGDFVDLNYARSSGSPIRGLFHDDGGGSVAQVPQYRLEDFASPFSGLELAPDGTARFPKTWQQSGRFILSRGGGQSTVSSFFQPIYDTWTTAFAEDKFDQEGRSTPFSGGGLTFSYGTVRGRFPFNVLEPFTPPIIPPAPSYTFDPLVSYRNWSRFPGKSLSEGSFNGQWAGSQNDTFSEIQPSNNPIPVTPPIPEPLQAIQVTLRVFDISAGQIRQQSIIEDF